MFTSGVLGGTICLMMLVVLSLLLLVPFVLLWVAWKVYRGLGKTFEGEADREARHWREEGQRERQRERIKDLYMADPRICDFSAPGLKKLGVSRNLMNFSVPRYLTITSVPRDLLLPHRKRGKRDNTTHEACGNSKTENPRT